MRKFIKDCLGYSWPLVIGCIAVLILLVAGCGPEQTSPAKQEEPGGLHPQATGKVTFYVQVLNQYYQTDHEVPITVTFTSIANDGSLAPIKTYDDGVEHPTPWKMAVGTTGPVVLALDFGPDILSIDMANSAPLLPGYTLVCWTKGEALIHPDTMVDVTNGAAWADLKHIDCLFPG